jgi:Flp pilus assembly protein TadD
MVCAILAIAVLAVYARTVGFTFVGLDDPNYVARNPHVLGGPSLEGIAWAFTTTHEANWHPLTWISLMIDARLGGGSPRAFHLTNLVLHLVNALLVYFVLIRMTGFRWRSALVAAWFAVHPLHVESVAWVVERKDLLSALFGLLAVLAYLGYARRPAVSRYSLVFLAFALSLLAKPMLVTLPLLLLVADFWPLHRLGPVPGLLRGWSPLWEKVPMLVLSAASSAATVHAQSSSGSLIALETFPLGVRLANAAVSCATYLVKAVWPAPLAVPYPYRPDALTPLKVGAALALLLGISALSWRARARRPWLLAGWSGYLVALLPVIGIVQVGTQAMADRYTYLPLLGPFVMIAWTAADLLKPEAGARRRAIAATLAGGTTIALAATAWVQAGHWRGAESLFAHARAATGRNAVAASGLGLVRFEQGRIEEAIGLYREALAISPTFADAHANLALALARTGRFDEAEEHYRKALGMRPKEPLMYVNLGVVLLQTGKLEEAADLFRRALTMSPDDPVAHRWLGVILLRDGRSEEAVRHLDEAVRLEPSDPGARSDRERARRAAARDFSR